MTSLPDRAMLDAARAVDVSITQIPMSRLIRLAIAHYNARRTPDKRPATIDSAEPFLHRLCVNWLRHTGSNYDHNRNRVRATGGQTLSDSAGHIIKQRTLMAIAAQYPVLAGEAHRQLRELETSRTSPRSGRPTRGR